MSDYEGVGKGATAFFWGPDGEAELVAREGYYELSVRANAPAGTSGIFAKVQLSEDTLDGWLSEIAKMQKRSGEGGKG